MIGGYASPGAMARRGLCAGLLLAIGGCDDTASPEPAATPQAAVVVWATPTEFPLSRVLAGYTKASGQPVEVVSDAPSPPARTDLVLTSDLGVLSALNGKSGLRPTYSDTLEANVPAVLRDPDSMWFGISWRPLAIAYDPGSVDAGGLTDYTALAAERWRGRLCLSTSSRAANRLLLAALIAELGEPAAERTVRGWVANLAANPFASDDELLAAIAGGGCELGIVDAGVFAGRSLDPEALAVTGPGRAFASVTAAGVARHATNPDGAAALLEWLSGESAQAIIKTESAALPAHPGMAPDPPLASVGSRPPGPLPAAQAAAWLGAAVLLAERAGYR